MAHPITAGRYGPGYYPAPGYATRRLLPSRYVYDPATGTFLGYDACAILAVTLANIQHTRGRHRAALSIIPQAYRL